MSTPQPQPTPDVQTVVTDVHQVLDTAKQQAEEAIAAVEHLNLGDLAAEARQLLHDGIELVKERLSALFHGSQPSTPAAPVPSQDTPTA